MSNEFEQPVEPMSRTEDLLRTGTEEPVIAMSRIEQILRGEKIKPQSRIEDLLLKYNPSDILIEKSITENGTYYARMDNADGYYKVVVDTPVIPPTVLEHLVETISTNGTHTFTPGTGVDGFSDASISVNVPANVTSRGLQVNGTFSSAVDSKDGYNSVTVNVQEAPVKTTSLSVTANGTYEPGTTSEISLTIPTIPDEVETDVSAGATITNFDNLRIEFTNKTTSATGHVDIYPSAIATQRIPMSFKNRTLIMGPDGDHYITIVNGYDSIVVLQKGYTITAMKLTSYPGYFDEVSVDVPTGPDIDYLYDWDFTKSLTDKIEGQTAVLLKDATRDSDGIHFYTRFDGCKLFDSIDLIGKTIEIDVSSTDKKGTNGALITHSRDDAYGTMDAGNTSIEYSQNNGTWGAYGPKLDEPTVQVFQKYDDNIGSDFFEGKTLKIVYVNDGSLLYVNNNFIGFQTNINLFNVKVGSSWYTRHRLSLGGNGINGTDCFYDAVITGCRIYNNILTEKTITENGTYYAPDDNVDGYLKVNANIPLGTKSIAANGTYAASSDSLAGYSSVTVNVPSAKAFTGYNQIFKEGGMDIQLDPSGKFKTIWNTASGAIGCTMQGHTNLIGTYNNINIKGNITDSCEYVNKYGYTRTQFVFGVTGSDWPTMVLVDYNDYGDVYEKEVITLTDQQVVNNIDIDIDLNELEQQGYLSAYLFISLLGISGEFEVTIT